MTTADQTKGFLDTMLARLVAVGIAILLAFVLWSNWAADFKILLAAEEGVKPVANASEPAKPVNPALEACLTQRVGDVDRMKEEGILSDAQYSAFRLRAEGLCRAQNPG